MLKYTASEQIKIAIGVTSLILLTVVLMPLALFFIPAAFGITTLGYPFFTFCIVPAMIGALVFDLHPFLSSVMGAFLFLIFMYFTYFGEDISMIIGKFFKKICKKEEIKGILSRILKSVLKGCAFIIFAIVVSLVGLSPAIVAYYIFDLGIVVSVLFNIICIFTLKALSFCYFHWRGWSE